MRTGESLEDLVTIAAWMYYVENQTQERIAAELGLSRVKVSRLLAKAREQGVVQFRITRPLPEYYALRKELQKRFRLKLVAVAKDRSSLGTLGADVLLHLIEERKPKRIGLGWSTTVSMMASHITGATHLKKRECYVHDLAGSYVGLRNPYSISWLVAEVLEAHYVPLPVPVLVENPQVMKESTIERALKEASEVDIAFVGMGCMGARSTLLKTGLVSKAIMDNLEAKGAIGEVLMRFFDENGRPIRTPLDERIVSIGWEAIEKIPLFVVMAAGEEKIKPLKAALKGGWMSGLVTDKDTAKKLLEVE